MPKIPMKKDTSWDRVANWYGKLLEGDGTYQKDLILPNLMRLMDVHRGEKVLDLACGPGFFSREFAARGANVTGVDASPKLIEMARENFGVAHGSAKSFDAKNAAPEFFISHADKLPFIKDASIDKVAIVLALQNIENVAGVLRECMRVLKKEGTLAIVMNHPAFRIPQVSAWGWDEKANAQYRRVDRYLSELKNEIQMHPGAKPSERTISFHRPLQFYFKALHKAGFVVAELEEWNSNRKSESGPRAKAEDLARKEIPLFICLVAVK